ncbi:MAG: aldose epimerase family protein, partial [Desulfocucumaceae bacterium]
MREEGERNISIQMVHYLEKKGMRKFKRLAECLRLGILVPADKHSQKMECRTNGFMLVKKLPIRNIGLAEAELLGVLFRDERSLKALKRIIFMREENPLTALSYKNLLSLRGIGRITLDEIQNVVALEEEEIPEESRSASPLRFKYVTAPLKEQEYAMETFIERERREHADMRIFRSSDLMHNSSFEVVPEAGSTAISYTVRGREILFYPGGIPILGPFANRIRDSKFTDLEGKLLDLSGLEQERATYDRRNGNHIYHGMVRKRPWEVEQWGKDQGGVYISCSFDSRKQAYEALRHLFGEFKVRVTYRLKADKLKVVLNVRSFDNRPLLMSWAFHPWFNTPQQCNWQVMLPVRKYWPSFNQMPTGPPVRADGNFYFRHLRTLNSLSYDDVFTDLFHDASLLYNPAEGTIIKVTQSSIFKHIVFYAPADKDTICIEPQTSATDAFNLYNEKGIREATPVILEPGRAFSASMIIEAKVCASPLASSCGILSSNSRIAAAVSAARIYGTIYKLWSGISGANDERRAEDAAGLVEYLVKNAANLKADSFASSSALGLFARDSDSNKEQLRFYPKIILGAEQDIKEGIVPVYEEYAGLEYCVFIPELRAFVGDNHSDQFLMIKLAYELGILEGKGKILVHVDQPNHPDLNAVSLKDYSLNSSFKDYVKYQIEVLNRNVHSGVQGHIVPLVYDGTISHIVHVVNDDCFTSRKIETLNYLILDGFKGKGRPYIAGFEGAHAIICTEDNDYEYKIPVALTQVPISRLENYLEKNIPADERILGMDTDSYVNPSIHQGKINEKYLEFWKRANLLFPVIFMYTSPYYADQKQAVKFCKDVLGSRRAALKQGASPLGQAGTTDPGSAEFESSSPLGSGILDYVSAMRSRPLWFLANCVVIPFMLLVNPANAYIPPKLTVSSYRAGIIDLAGMRSNGACPEMLLKKINVPGDIARAISRLPAMTPEKALIIWNAMRDDYERGEFLFNREKFGQAMAAWERAESIFNNIAGKTKETYLAPLCYRRAIAGLYGVGILYLEEAEILARKAVEIDPEFGGGYFLLGWITYTSSQERTLFRNVLRKTRDISARVPYYHLAVEYFKKAEEHNFRNPGVYLQKAGILLELAELENNASYYRQAMKDFYSALEFDLEMKDVLVINYQIAYSLIKLNNFSRAVDVVT